MKKIYFTILELLLLISIIGLLTQSIIEMDKLRYSIFLPSILTLLYNMWTLKNIVSVRDIVNSTL